jgi:hypothetical protein
MVRWSATLRDLILRTRLTSVADLFERIRISMPLDRPSTLSRAQTADVTAFLLKENKWPAGSAELPRELEALKEITIQALKP